MTANPYLSAATDFFRAGLSVIPIRVDGTKKPLREWMEYRKRLATPTELSDWYSQPCGAAVVCGTISGGLEILDFDHDADEVFTAWYRSTENIACRLPVVETPSGGRHVYFRCREMCANTNIALTADGKKKRIETRGDGGYVITVFSPAKTHPRNYPYVQVMGPVLPDVPTITPDERLELWKAARRWHVVKKRPRPFYHSLPTHDPNRVERASKCVAKIDPAVSGQAGHNKTYHVACVLVDKFQLEFSDAMAILCEYNARCVPPWSEKELVHKLDSAWKLKN